MLLMRGWRRKKANVFPTWKAPRPQAQRPRPGRAAASPAGSCARSPSAAALHPSPRFLAEAGAPQQVLPVTVKVPKPTQGSLFKNE